MVSLFQDELHYRYLGDWSDRSNSNIDEDLLAVYSLLRYGVSVQTEAGALTETLHLINWREPEKNDFALAEEVALRGQHQRRPDLVLYLNGIAIAVIELKNSRVSLGEGIRQLISNQQPQFHAWFFATVQIVFAGNDSEGLRYGTITTPEKYFLSWKENEGDAGRFTLDKYLLKMCDKSRLLELLHDFVVFDGGIKKLPRVHQYMAVRAAQQHVHQYQGGIIWHTQGSGKSIVMVLLGKWILENKPHARVAIITDRDELDKQIERVFTDAGETIARTGSGRDLMRQLALPLPRLLCSLVHKFGRRDVDDFEAFLQDLQAAPSRTSCEIFVFVDECHRSQGGKLHRIMKAMLPSAVFIGFTGTPLLKKDKQTTIEVFGTYIHTYKFGEAVDDGVVLDLVYEARDIDQKLGAEDKDFGYIVDYKNLFKKVENAIAVYTSELDAKAGEADPQILLRERLTTGRERLDTALEAIRLVCEPVQPPQGELEHIRYFCGNTEIPTDLAERQPLRVGLYLATVALVRAYANIGTELAAAGYQPEEIAGIKKEVKHFIDLRETIRKASGETLDLKAYEADMRHLIDTYIEAAEPRTISPFAGMLLLELIVKTGIAEAIAAQPEGIRENKDAIAETIENNVRSKIIKSHLHNPAFYEKMSQLLQELIVARKSQALEYQQYLQRIAELVRRVEAGFGADTPKTLNSPGKRALYDNLERDEGLALRIDTVISKNRPEGWSGYLPKEQKIKELLYGELHDIAEVERIFRIIYEQREY